MAEEQGIISYDPATTNMMLDRMYRNRDSFPFDTEAKPESEKGITSGAVYAAVSELKGATVLNKGYWPDSNSLMAGVPSAEEGSIAYVGANAPYAIYRYASGGWADTGQTYTPEVDPGEFKVTVDKELDAESENPIANRAVKDTMDKITTEYNVSAFHPDGGIGGTDKYTLETAIVKVPESLRNVGIKCSFLDEGGKPQTWEFTGGEWAGASFSQVGSAKMSELKDKITELEENGGGTADVDQVLDPESTNAVANKAVTEKISELEDITNSMSSESVTDEKKLIKLLDDEDNELFTVDKDGLSAKTLRYKGSDGLLHNVETDKQDKLEYDESPTDGSKKSLTSGAVYSALQNVASSDIEKETTAELDESVSLLDGDGNEILKADKDGILSKDFRTPSGKSLLTAGLPNPWTGSTWAEYGDSFTQMFCNGDYSVPYEINENTGWGILVADALNFARYMGRGISGSSIQWQEGRAKTGLVDADTGVLLEVRNELYDDVSGVPSGQTKIRDIGCSWSRITGMFPETIKDRINVLTVFLHNDWLRISDECQWLQDDATDPEWTASEYYPQYGGDYNIETWRGSICSLVMKFQAWMPNARLILCTPASGSVSYGEDNRIYPERAYEGAQFEKSEIMRETAKRLSIPLIDVNATCGINMLNRTSYLQDYIHPNATAGQRAVAQSFIGGFHTIYKL